MFREILAAIADYPWAFILLCVGANVVLSGLRTALVRAGGNIFGMYKIVTRREDR